MEERTVIGMIIAAFIGVIVAFGLLAPIADQQGVLTTKSNIINETVDLSTAWTENGYNANTSVTFTVSEEQDAWKQTKCKITSFTFANGSEYFTVTTDYTFNDATGVITLVPTAAINRSGNTTYASYTHCRDGYETDSGTRSIFGLITLFAGLGVAIFVVVRALRALKG